MGATPTAGGAALPHLHVPDIDAAEVVLARSREGIRFEVADSLGDAHQTDEPIHAIFFLVSPEEDPGMHLRLLAQLANVIDDDDFVSAWIGAGSVAHIKELLLQDTHYLSLRVRRLDATAPLVDSQIRAIQLPTDCIVAIIRRGDDMIVPRGDTTLLEGDRITFIGEPQALDQLRRTYLNGDADESDA